MKTNIYTIPVIDAFKADDECPFCFIERQLEQEAISFILGPAYMEADIREDTDKLGFCRHHHKMMYDYGNQLGVALMLDTYYQKMTKELKNQLKSFSPQKSSMLKRLKNSEIHDKAHTSIGQWIETKESTCYVCNHFQSKYPRYIDTFLQLATKDKDFFELFKNSKGFCLHHFKDVIEMAEDKLSENQKKQLYPELFRLMEENMDRVAADISWFVDKYDYRNKVADWKNSKDANQRGIQKIHGGYPADPVFRKLN